MIISKAQTIWNYIRRNPIFRVGDIAMVTDISVHTIMGYLGSWSNGGYIEFLEGKKPADKTYRLLKKSVFAPARTLDGKAKDREPKTKKGQKMIKELQTKAERAQIRFTHEEAKPKKAKTFAKAKRITFEARLIKGAKGIGYSPTMFGVDKEGNIICKETGFAADKIYADTTGDSYGFTAA